MQTQTPSQKNAARIFSIAHQEANAYRETRGRNKGGLYEFPSRTSSHGYRHSNLLPPYESGDFFKDFSIDALIEFESIAEVHSCPCETVLIREEQKASSVLFLIEGRVKLSINSIDGRRLILRIAWPGEILGLTAAFSGLPHTITAEALFPCMFKSIDLQLFLDFVGRYPTASRNAARELSLDYNRATEQLRTLGLTLSAPAKLIRLILDWCAKGEQTPDGIRIQCSLTHGEIGEHLGVSRETVSRSLMNLKSEGVIEQRGSTLMIPNLQALRAFAETD